MQIIIDSRKIEVKKGQTVLEVAKSNGIYIPTLCFHSDLKPGASCRLCLVEVKGNLHTACSLKVEDGMEIITDSTEIRKARRINLELLFSQHIEECNDCIQGHNCHFLELARRNGVKITRFEDRKKGEPVYSFGPSLIFDSSKCIDCRNCVEMCKKQGINFLETEKEGAFLKVVPTKDKKKDCIYCGQCIVHCPVGAFEAVGEFEDIEVPLRDKDKFIVFQIAPAVRSSIGEEFGLNPSPLMTGKIVAAVRKLGADKVFDTSVGADFTTFEEAKEIIERHNSDNIPIFSSCCPAWVKFVEFYHPELIPRLATTRSPQMILGALIKTYWAEKQGINPKNILVVSVMPCVSKKYEITRKELMINGLKPVDYVLTTRELAYLLIKNKINLINIEPEKLDSPFGDPSGAGVIYGASGGVMESALRTAYKTITGRELIDFEEVRGEEGLKTFSAVVNGKELRAAVVNGIGNISKVLNKLDYYHCIEVMACPGGCIGGGGQPVPSDIYTRRKRAEALYNIDASKKLRLAHENPDLINIYKSYLDEDKIKKFFHTSYHKKHREN